ncbi:hypothetical protein D3C81_1469350 [compost metagenome]
MIEQDAAATEDVVALAVVDGHPVRIELGHAIGTARIEGSAFHLRDSLDLAEHFGSAGLIEADLRVDDTDRFQKVHRTDAGDLGSGHRLVERYTDKALGGEIVDLGGAGRLQQANAGRQVGQVVLDQMQVGVVLDAQLLDPPEVHRAGAAVGAIHLVAFLEQKLGQICPVLSANAGNNCSFHVSWCLCSSYNLSGAVATK